MNHSFKLYWPDETPVTLLFLMVRSNKSTIVVGMNRNYYKRNEQDVDSLKGNHSLGQS